MVLINMKCETRKDTTFYKKGESFIIKKTRRIKTNNTRHIIVYPSEARIPGTGVYMSNVRILGEVITWKSRCLKPKAL